MTDPIDVVHVLPAPEWWALYRHSDLGPERFPLIAWAFDGDGEAYGLVEGDRGYSATVGKAFGDNFAGYYRTGSRVCLCSPGDELPGFAEDPTWCPPCRGERGAPDGSPAGSVSP